MKLFNTIVSLLVLISCTAVVLYKSVKIYTVEYNCGKSRMLAINAFGRRRQYVLNNIW